jgi:hypothetical protein
MPRPLRIEYIGVYYQAMNRGLTGQAVFLSEADCKDFSLLIEDEWRRWDILQRWWKLQCD